MPTDDEFIDQATKLTLLSGCPECGGPTTVDPANVRRKTGIDLICEKCGPMGCEWSLLGTAEEVEPTPNAETAAVLRDADSGKGLGDSYADVGSLMRDLADE